MMVIGYLVGWALLTLGLTVASRSIHLGPGFANPLPYAAVAMAMHLLGKLIRRWLGEKHGAPPETKPGILGGFLRGLQTFFRDTAAFNNLILLTVAYVFGAGTSALFARLGRKHESKDETTYWTDTDLGKKEADAYYRPY